MPSDPLNGTDLPQSPAEGGLVQEGPAQNEPAQNEPAQDSAPPERRRQRPPPDRAAQEKRARAQDADIPRDVPRDPVRLGDRYEITPSNAVPLLDTAAGKAYGARVLRGGRKVDCYALVCSGLVPPRSDALNALSAVDTPGLPRLLDWGVVDWAQGTRRMALFFERPVGRRIMSGMDAQFEPLSEEVIMRSVLQPAASALKELIGRGITHGNIRPTNMFLRDGGLVLMECASTPPGFGQPVLFESIERGMAVPAGRGNGSAGDDLYALGVSVLVLAIGHQPVPGLNDDTILTMKIDRGSFSALVGSHRIPANLIEPIRGLLIDDPRQRWGVGQLDLWLSGRRLSPKQTQMPKRASRPLSVGRHEAWTTRGLAMALVKEPMLGLQLIEGGELERWLKRSLADESLIPLIADAVSSAAANATKSSTTADRAIARVASTLDPAAPIRYKGRGIMPDAIGIALADAALRREHLQQVAEILAAQLPLHWANVQPEARAELVPLVKLFDGMRSVLDKVGPGYGIERVVYETNTLLHCLSPIILEQTAITPAEVLLALDTVATSRGRPREPMDRHIAAFLFTRHRGLNEVLLNQLMPGIDPMRRVASILTILGDIQARHGVSPVPNLCHWLVSLMEPAISRFYNRVYREQVRKEAEKRADDGKLLDLLKMIDDPDAVRKDISGFTSARLAHRKSVLEIDTLREYIADPQTIAETTGRQVAAIVAGVTGILICAALVLMYSLN